ncbi:DUF1294 domain-containing protein [Pseudolactococcus insecticola]|nr:DUF1294 domain-containing protein [Lactococcus insecticola]
MMGLFAILVIWNLVVFVIYGEDKRRAKRGLWRISEKTLLLSAVLFGGIGALLAGHVFHHKTRKVYFQIIWWIGVIIDCVAIVAIIRNLT